MKFIDRTNIVQKKNNHKEIIVSNLNPDNNEMNVHNEKSNTKRENEITGSLENEVLPDELMLNGHQPNLVSQTDSSEKKANDDPCQATHVEEKSLSLKNQLVPTQINIGISNSANSQRKDKSLVTSSQPKQKTQPDYFKQTKPFSANRSGKIKMPEIQEIDMNVLVELPEDIRNEILNEYKQNKNNEKPGTSSRRETREENRNNENDVNFNSRLQENLSFSQIDPEFLAALPEEMKNEVKSYCNAKKKEKLINEDTPTNNIAHKGWGMFKSEKQPQKSTKSKAGKVKVTKGTGKKDTKSNASSVNDKKVKEKGVTSSKNKIQEINQNSQIEKRPDISAARSFHFDPANGNAEHSEILSSLVDCLLDLPIIKVRLHNILLILDLYS